MQVNFISINYNVSSIFTLLNKTILLLQLIDPLNVQVIGTQLTQGHQQTKS